MMDRYRHIRTILSFGFLSFYAAFYAAACGPDETGGPAPTGGVDSSCVPSSATGPVASSCGIFASASTGDDANDGSQAKPVKTLAKAIDMAKSKKLPVYACAEAFAESISVTEGVTLFGGLNCVDAGWAYVGATTKTTLSPEADKVPLTVVAGDGTARFEDLAVVAADAAMPGGSSIAVIADGVDVEFVRSSITSGAGATGETGLQPSDDVGPADPSHPDIRGNDGNAACMGGMGGNFGGPAKTNDKCSMTSSGAGGTAQELSAGNGEDGMPAPDPNPDKFGVGGIAAMGVNSCQAGQSGAAGVDGTPGLGAQDLGTIDAKEGYVGGVGAQGTKGTAGQGGGGGGAAIGKIGCYGASGGSGGTGGCGGSGGLGGKGGGSSFAVLSVSSTLRFMDTTLTSGAGGKGGDGGGGQAGGIGGKGGNGGASGPQVKAACGGGDGGQGGPGGMGGGGRGGHSAVVAFKGTAPDLTGVTVMIGAFGPGGAGGNAEGTGADGVALNEIEFK